MNCIRAWIVRTIFGKAQSEAPGDGQMRESWDELYEPTPDHRKERP